MGKRGGGDPEKRLKKQRKSFSNCMWIDSLVFLENWLFHSEKWTHLLFYGFIFFFGTRLSLLAHLSLKLKWAILIALVRLSLHKLFYLFLQNHGANFNQTWHKASLGEGNQVFSNMWAHPFPRGDNYKIAKILFPGLICGHTLFQGEIITKLQKYFSQV